jgi:hypothetical protein
MKKLILFIIGFVLFSCKKVEVKPQQPLDPQPIITDTTFVDSTVSLKNTTWVITKVLNTQMIDDPRSDTLKFISNTIYSFNGVQATYSIYSTPSGYKLNLNNTQWGHICGSLVEYNLTIGKIESNQFNDVFTGDFAVKIWMYKQ